MGTRKLPLRRLRIPGIQWLNPGNGHLQVEGLTFDPTPPLPMNETKSRTPKDIRTRVCHLEQWALEDFLGAWL
jgi:hypothetical protein